MIWVYLKFVDVLIIFLWIKWYNVIEGDVVEFYCMSDGRLSLRVKWIKIGVVNDVLVFYLDKWWFMIKYVNWIDVGIYRCMVVNGIG